VSLLYEPGGPVEQYLRLRNLSRGDFHDLLKAGDPAAASVYAAESVCAAVRALGGKVRALSLDVAREFARHRPGRD
jgi:hypothetical protein